MNIRESELFPTWSNPLAVNFPIKGKVTGSSHWQRVRYDVEVEETIYRLSAYADTSTLDENGDGEAYVFEKKDCMQHMNIAISVLIAEPFHAAGTILFNAVRIIPVVTYLAVTIFTADPSKEGILGQRTVSHIKEMGEQIWLSIANIIRTPYYLLGILVGTLFAFVDPLNGRKIVYSFEQAWNHNLDRKHSYWSVNGPQVHFAFEGGSEGKLGRHAFCIPGCYYPNAVAIYKNHQLVGMKTLGGRALSNVLVIEKKGCCS